jgi:hypothetical protein
VLTTLNSDAGGHLACLANTVAVSSAAVEPCPPSDCSEQRQIRLLSSIGFSSTRGSRLARAYSIFDSLLRHFRTPPDVTEAFPIGKDAHAKTEEPRESKNPSHLVALLFDCRF